MSMSPLLDDRTPMRSDSSAVPISTLSLLVVTAALLAVFVIMSATAPAPDVGPSGVPPTPTWMPGPVLTTAPGEAGQPTATLSGSPGVKRTPTTRPRPQATATAVPTATATAIPPPRPTATPVPTVPIGGG